ncbi:hypothetical protein LMH87_003297 [Akanthomyces muscarius]|uniref:Alpha-L-rhamnosidase n=1 Tax=Akanthomyces muscarius TaxID=2231603 RepID=A0A9W8Q161_AKAMU|nr:hypothetical protein LMH87_003297 [Akanthomyces muscarius]KAJ4144413.1 hypothetical protein LMH87_003297 [Akanthomyces muscarius]
MGLPLISIALLAAAIASGLPQRDAPQPSWHQYVRSPSSNTVKPVRILGDKTSGSVQNPNGLINGNGATVLSRPNTNDPAPAVVVDFGQNVVGLLSVHFAKSVNGSGGLPGVRLAFSETLQFLGDRSDFTRSDNAGGSDKITQGTDQIAVQNNAYTWQDKHGCQSDGKVCSDGLHGFRYVKIWLDALASDAPHTSSSGSVSISSIDLEWSAYLGTPNTFTGWFECSDKDLTQWWYDGVYTVDMGTDLFLANETEPRGAASQTLVGKQVLFDGAKRDRDPYVGDMAVASLTSYLSHNFAEPSLNVLEDLAKHQRSDGWIPPASINGYTLPLFDYPLWWAICSVDLVMYTGNTAFAKTYWNTLKKVLDNYYAQYIDKSSGLLVKSAGMGYGDYAFLPRSGPITYYNALYVRALRYAAQLARGFGGDYASSASSWESRAASISAAVAKHNFDTATGAFFDGGPCPGQPAGTYCKVHSQDGNSLAIMAGVVNTTTSQQVLDYWAKTTAHPYGNAFYDSSVLSPGDHFDERVYAFISYFELEARFLTTDRADSAIEEIRRLYGWMSAHDPQITMWEGIGPGGSPYEGGFTSMAHGWSTGIVPLMSNHVLGVKPMSPGFASWQICPAVGAGGLKWAKGVVPTPLGGIEVSWATGSEAGSGKKLTMYISAPKNTSGAVCVPLVAGASRVEVDGKAVPVKKGAKSVVVNVKGGLSHSVTAE